MMTIDTYSGNGEFMEVDAEYVGICGTEVKTTMITENSPQASSSEAIRTVII